MSDETWNTCPSCGKRWADAEPTPGLLHRTRKCAECKTGASVIYRQGPLTYEDYHEAMGLLYEGSQQLEPDGKGCRVCGDTDHQAWECHHNPLVMARRAAKRETEWRCFHCGTVFTDEAAAREHFGRDEWAPVACLDLVKALEAKRQDLLLSARADRTGVGVHETQAEGLEMAIGLVRERVATQNHATFQSELAALINRHSLEGASNTPDFLLAKLLEGVLVVFDETVVERERWHGRGGVSPATAEKGT